jgi:hypothetical protein
LNDAALVANADVRFECMHGRMLPGQGCATSAGMIAAPAGGCVADRRRVYSMPRCTRPDGRALGHGRSPSVLREARVMRIARERR